MPKKHSNGLINQSTKSAFQTDAPPPDIHLEAFQSEAVHVCVIHFLTYYMFKRDAVTQSHALI